MNLVEREERLFFRTYKRLDLEIEKGEGCFLISKDGNRYLDFFSGLAVNSLGHSHPKIIEAITNQINRYIHLSNIFLQRPQIELAELLLEITGYSKVFFSNSGTEAMEGAIKLARKWGNSKNNKEIIYFSGAFHGRTMGALSLTDREIFRSGYEPFLHDVIRGEYNNPTHLIENVNENTLAVVLEFIQGESGVRETSQLFVNTLESLRSKYNFLLIADEIQSGLGRTGKFFAFNYHNIKPDIVVIAKPLGGGLPLGAILGSEKVSKVFTYGVHGTTFGGNPVACAAGLATINEIVNQGIMKNAKEVGDYLKDKLIETKIKFPNIISDIRGKGLMIGIEINRDCEMIVADMIKQHVLINCTNNNVIRLLPPLIISSYEVDYLINSFENVLSKIT